MGVVGNAGRIGGPQMLRERIGYGQDGIDVGYNGKVCMYGRM